MSFIERESSPDRGAPIELYEFRYGPDIEHAYRYTNARMPISDGPGPGGPFLPIPIKRDPIKQNGKMEKTSINVRVPVTTDISELFLPYPPAQVVRLRLWQRHLTDGDHQDLVTWTGRVISSARERNEAVLTCDNSILSLKRQGLRRLWQHGCPYLLYSPKMPDGSGCGADKASFTRSVTVVGLNPDGSIQFPADWNAPYPVKNFKGGTIEWTSPLGREYRTIIDTGDSWIKVGGFIRGVEADTEVQVSLGCGHDMPSCKDIFDNINNYGGQPWIPFKNPIKQHPFW